MAEQAITSMLLRTQLPSSTPRPPVAASRSAVGVLDRSTALAPKHTQAHVRKDGVPTYRHPRRPRWPREAIVWFIRAAAPAARSCSRGLAAHARCEPPHEADHGQPAHGKALLLPCQCPLGRYRGPQSGLLSLADEQEVCTRALLYSSQSYSQSRMHADAE
jgi:hypothetical protein